MYEYTIQAYDQTDLGKVNSVELVVCANTDEDAIEKAQKLKARQQYSVIRVKELSNKLKKG